MRKKIEIIIINILLKFKNFGKGQLKKIESWKNGIEEKKKKKKEKEIDGNRETRKEQVP
jgi:hypothetical protein